jgi:hypothetical protein
VQNRNLLTTNKNSTQSKSSYQPSGSYHDSGSYSTGYSDYNSWGTSIEPTLVFKAHGIEFWGSSRENLRDVKDMSKSDLIVNCSGTEFIIVPFVKMAPSWINLSGRVVGGVQAHQVLLNWNDMSPPPVTVNIKFWEDIVAQSKDNGIRRIFSCCGAGQGRTGTALAAFLLATGMYDEPDDAVNYLRNRYSSKAVETDGQEIYLFNLVYNLEELFKDASKDE